MHRSKALDRCPRREGLEVDDLELSGGARFACRRTSLTEGDGRQKHGQTADEHLVHEVARQNRTTDVIGLVGPFRVGPE